MTEEQALKLLKKYSSNADLFDHVLMVAKGMRKLAEALSQDVQKWAVISILHGLAYKKFLDKTKLDLHEIFEAEKLDGETTHAILAHGFGSFTDTKPTSQMEYIFCAADQTAGLILSSAILFCGGDTDKVDAAMVKSLFGNKDFRVGTQRVAQSLESAGVDLDWFLSIVL